MKLSNTTISKLVEYVVGDNHEPYRTGSQIISLFNEYGGFDYLPSNGMPMMPNSSLRYSRKIFAEQKMAEMNDTLGLRQLIEYVVNKSESPSVPEKISSILSRDGYVLKNEGNSYRIIGGVIDNTKPIANEAYFNNLEKQVLDALSEAKVSIHIAMAWFTNETIKAKLLEKQKEGVEVDIIIYDDKRTEKHRVDLSDFPHTIMKGTRGGIMHNKYCIIDNQVVLQGSYNWTNNAETRNDESVAILRDPQIASEYSVKFKQLKNKEQTIL